MKGELAPADLSKLRYPLIASEKIDGWRCLVADINWARANIPCEPKHRPYFDAAQHCIALSASNKPISNRYVQRMLDRPELAGCDGELIASEKFNETSSAFASFGGEPSFAFHIFDRFDEPNLPFSSRLFSLYGKKLPDCGDNVNLIWHSQCTLEFALALDSYIERKLSLNAEGVIVRDPAGLYKYGRSTVRQQWMLKIKNFQDAEAVVVGWEELMHNENEPEVSQMGLQKRSHHQAGKILGGKLGALVCISTQYTGLTGTGPRFKIGTGFDDQTRCLLWAMRKSLPGKIVKYKSMTHGVLEAPRHPVFLGFRAEDYSA
jgi:DNA ligase-1